MYDAAAVLRSSSICMIVAGATTFIACSIIAAPYGRYNTAKGWGFLVPAKLSWFLMESPNLWMPPLVYGCIGSADRLNSKQNKFLLGMFLLHYFQRSIIYPIFRVNGLRHEPTPVSVTLLAFCYCCWNSFNQAVALLVVTVYPDEWLTDFKFVAGFLVFCIGFTINITADSTLLALKGKSVGNKVYSIPYGGIFEYVSCANYFGEIIEWTGYAIACWSLPALAFAIYTFCNLGPRAVKHHEWYKIKFHDYPRNRKAVIPFLW